MKSENKSINVRKIRNNKTFKKIIQINKTKKQTSKHFKKQRKKLNLNSTYEKIRKPINYINNNNGKYKQ